MEITFYSNPIKSKSKTVEGNEEQEKTPLEEWQKKAHSKTSSLNRTKSKIYDYARANKWEYFVTLTLDKTKIDRYDYEIISDKVSKWLRNTKYRKAPNLKYLIVPEQHKDGAWHFHAVVSDIEGLTLIDSGKRTEQGETIYNIKDYKLGFNSIIPIGETNEDSLRVSNYITKYITKELIVATEGKRRYWPSSNLEEPTVQKELIEKREFEEIAKTYGIKHRKEVTLKKDNFEQIMTIYTVKDI